MSYETFPLITVGAPATLRVIDRCFTHKDDFGLYVSTRAAATKKPKSFECSWTVMEWDKWNYFLEFWRRHGNHTMFYFEFPLEIHGVGGFWGVDAETEDPGGWDFEEDGVVGGGPVFLCRFREPELAQEWEGPPVWGWSAIIDEVA